MLPRARMSLIRLRLAMLGTLAAIIGLATLVLTVILSWLGVPFGIYTVLGIVVVFHILQWLFAPYIINAIYRVRPIEAHEYPWLHEALSRISATSGLSAKPKLMLAEIDIPNAFAYGSPITGNFVAVTRGLLSNLPREEVEAVVGHELGHVKHKDVMFMMIISIIPALLYYLGHILYYSGWLGGASRDQRGGGALLVLIGVGLMVLSFIFNLFVFYFSRLREHYADSHAATSVQNGARNLQRALVRIMTASRKIRKEKIAVYTQVKALFIADPEVTVRGYEDIDALVERIKAEKPNILMEIFSTHPHPAKRLRHLDAYIT
ncbi:MAG: zinc metalloprotease HtpX [Nitrososphaerota archaeon]|nr:zinc metalloprotease HtpX [Aigarchaeota archaeon]MDW8076203.1 zinc metalloprotease HtpX [Nitrososphaerota archaeon]